MNLLKVYQSENEAQLKRDFERIYPQRTKFIGRQVTLTPPQAWTEDQYQRQLGHLRSWARLKLTQLRHLTIEGASFETLVRENSHHISAQRGGLITLAQLSEEPFSPSMIRAIRELRIGELSPVFQDKNGFYLFYAEDQQVAFALDGEGVFWSNDQLSKALETQEFWKLLDRLCSTTYGCVLESILPSGVEGQRWREAWSKSAPEIRSSRRSERRVRSRTRVKGVVDQRGAPGRERSWSKISSEEFGRASALYREQLSQETLRELKRAGRGPVLERAPLYQALPLLSTPKGVGLIRLRARGITPTLNQPQLRMLSFDLTLRALRARWRDWGIERIGQQLLEAAKRHRLNEARNQK